MRTRLVIAIACLLLCSCAGRPGSGWDQAVNLEAGTRFIPLELWTGKAWKGELVIKEHHANVVFGFNNMKSIVGPTDWYNPRTGEYDTVYRRWHRGFKPERLQIYRVNDMQDGIGRVYDSQGGRFLNEASHFPLGLWREGESRSYADDYKTTIIIEKLDFVFRGVPHSLQYRWKIGDCAGCDVSYVYSPGQGLVDVFQHH